MNTSQQWNLDFLALAYSQGFRRKIRSIAKRNGVEAHWEDELHEALIKVARQYPDQPEAYLTTVFCHRLYSRSQQESFVRPLDDPERIENSSCHTPWERLRIFRLLEKLDEQLSTEEKDHLLLLSVSHKEIARKLSIRPATARKRASRLRKKVAALLMKV